MIRKYRCGRALSEISASVSGRCAKPLLSLLAMAALFLISVNVEPAHSGQEGRVKSITLPQVETELADGAGKEKVETYCSICHTTDYIPMQPRFPRVKWSAIVHKMIVVYGAPVNENDTKIIVDYISANYGSEEK